MDATIWGPILRPFLVLLLFAVVVIPIRLLLGWLIPDGRAKRFLFKKR